MRYELTQGDLMIITVANQKGGVGKTTTVMNLGCALHELGKRVLVIDSDPQGNLTSYLGVSPGSEEFPQTRTLDEIYLSKRPIDDDAKRSWITRTQAGVDLIAADEALAGVEYYLFSRSDRELVLEKFLSNLKRSYDFVLIDTPPSLNLLTINALCASDGVLIPVQPEFFSLEGIVKIRRSIDQISERWNPGLRISGVLATQVSTRRKLTREVLQVLQDELGSVLFDTQIHENASIAESSGHARSVLHYGRTSRGAKDYRSAAKELMNKEDPNDGSQQTGQESVR